MRRVFCFLRILTIGVPLAHGAIEVTDTETYSPAGSDRVILKGEVKLPSHGMWVVNETAGEDRVFLLPSQAAAEQYTGKRVTAMLRQRQTDRGRYNLRRIVAPAIDYARAHNNVGPKSVDDLDREKYGHAIDAFTRNPWGSVTEEGPYVFLVPEVTFAFAATNRGVERVNREILAVELRPYVDDGKHWITYTDGSSDRQEIDQAFLKRYDLAVRPVMTREETAAEKPAFLSYTLIAHLPRSAAAAAAVPVRNTHSGDTMDIQWQLSGARPGKADLAEDLGKVRQMEWWPHYQASRSPVLAVWMKDAGFNDPGQRRRRGRGSSVFGVMGGRAAVRETLQMQLIGSAGTDQECTIPVTTIQGVNVASHPYEEMLAGKEGGRLPLAEVVPADHFLLYVARPETMLGMLDDGAEFLSRLGGSFSGNSIKYYLKEKYLVRMGLSEKWLSLFLKSGGVKECAIMAPDLFFIDGTDVTVLSRLSKPGLVKPLLALVGVSGLSDANIVSTSPKGGNATYWASRGDLLMVSTSKETLMNVLKLKAADGKGSLGRSAEFRYMLTQLPLKDKTRAYAYMSDPFVRRLVGPQTKIGQLRRMLARGQMEQITASALLATLDSLADPITPETLIEKEYIPRTLAGKGYSLDRELTVHSDAYGTLANLAPLSALPIDKVTQKEADNYKQYVTRYNRFWRRFFDPIAIRLDGAADDTLELSVFILPLIDNSIYNGLKQAIMTKEDGMPLRVPRLAPDPVLMLSLNVKEEAWNNIAGEMSKMLMQYAHISPAVLDDLGPAVHLAINDADPVIALGSGDLLGAFGGNANIMGGGGEALWIPVALSVLTRPCTLAVETGDPDATLRYLRRASGAGFPSGRRRNDEMSVDFYKVQGEDSWVYSLDLMGIVKLRYGLEVQDGFLMIRNIPWSSKDRVLGVETAALNGAQLTAYPAACNLQLAGLHASAAEHQSASALQGAGMLYPLVESGHAKMVEAAAAHMQLFGFMPVHPAGGKWSWDHNEVVSSTFGSVTKRQHPAYEDGDTSFGLMKDIQSLSLQLQFEDTGLRTKIRWKRR